MKDIHESLRTDKLTTAEHRAIRALEAGEATPLEQKLALATIVKKLARAHDLTYLPGEPHESAFLAGRSYVGKQLLKYVNTSPAETEE